MQTNFFDSIQMQTSRVSSTLSPPRLDRPINYLLGQSSNTKSNELNSRASSSGNFIFLKDDVEEEKTIQTRNPSRVNYPRKLHLTKLRFGEELCERAKNFSPRIKFHRKVFLNFARLSDGRRIMIIARTSSTIIPIRRTRYKVSGGKKVLIEETVHP